MTLTDKEYKEFLKTHLDLLFYVGHKKNILPKDLNLKKFLNLDFQIKFKCRELLLENEDIVDEYIASNFNHLTTDQIEILLGFKKKIRSNFIIFKCLINDAIFIDTKDNKFYAVKALGDSFDTFFDNFPVNISTTLIPFKDKIIYDGFMQSSSVYYGRNMTQKMNEDYEEAKRNNEILTSLK
ncbi:MAG: hypothetical protein QM541_13545 [Flavobacterium sp.]|nr:hypothetical protein [Flavobacterium sp.]